MLQLVINKKLNFKREVSMQYRIVFDYRKAKYLVQFYSNVTKSWNPVSSLTFNTLKDCKEYLDNATVNYRG